MTISSYREYALKSTIVTFKLIAAIKSRDFEKIARIVSTYRAYINRSYVDKNGNTLMHIAAKSCVKPSWLDTTDSNKLFKSLYLPGMPYNLVNKSGEKPIDYLKNNWMIYAFNNATLTDIQFDEALERSRLNFLYNNKRIYPGRYVVELNLNLIYGSKKPHKVCQVPDKWEELDKIDNQDLTLHQRLAMAEAFAFNGAKNPDELSYDSSVNNYAVINIGFVVSNSLYIKKGEQGRRFITIPIIDALNSVLWQAFEKTRVHSEESLLGYIDNKIIIEHLLEVLSVKFGIKNGFKIFAIVFDIFSKNDMCDGCEEQILIVQARGKFVKHFENTAENKKYGYVLPKEKQLGPDILTPKTRRLHVVTRVSSKESYAMSRPRQDIDHGNSYEYPLFKAQTLPSNDIKTFYNSVTVHKRNPDEDFHDDETYKDLKGKLVVPNNTSFLNYFSGAKWGRKQSCTRRKAPSGNIFKQLTLNPS